jgi:cytochrome c biogenesis protein CcmG/thiol:disulfide interchange protein DsbE
MRITPARYALLAVLMLVAAAFLAPQPSTPSLAYRALRRFGFVLEANAPPPMAGRRLGRVALSSVGGDPVNLLPHTGRSMLIDVFASWCPPCRAELGALAEIAPRLKNAGIDVVGVDQEESAAQVRAVEQAYGISYPIYIDDGSAKSALGARIIPTTIFVDKHDVVRFVHAGPLNASQLLALARST